MLYVLEHGLSVVILLVFLVVLTLAINEEQIYSEAHYDAVCQTYGNPKQLLDKYDTIFIDSITVAGRLCFQWCQNQPDCKTSNGRLDTRAPTVCKAER